MPRGASVRKRGQLPVPSCQFVGCACAPCLCPGSVVRGAHPTKSDHKRLAQQVCHPERSEGSRGQILRCAQNDTSERLRRKVYQCHVFRFRCWCWVLGFRPFAFSPFHPSPFTLPLCPLSPFHPGSCSQCPSVATVKPCGRRRWRPGRRASWCWRSSCGP